LFYSSVAIYNPFVYNNLDRMVGEVEKAKKIWYIKPSHPKLQCELSKGLGVSPLVSQLLINRGIKNLEEAKSFLYSSINDLSDPWEIHGVKEACARFLLAKEKGERVLIFGDYDVDGLTATAVMVEFIQKTGLQVESLTPNRLQNGYGLSLEMLPAIEEKNCSLVITVDCGINSLEEVKLLKDKGIDVIITDHHLPGPILPEASAVINPKLKAPKEAYDLAGVGVAFKLVQALSEKLQLEDQTHEMLDLVALGTVADIVPLFGDNRILAKEGLDALSTTKRKGLKALIDVCGIKTDTITTQELSFGLAPRINAAGRVGDSGLALELLLTKSIQRSDELAKILDRTNKERQVIEGAILNQADEMLNQLDLSAQRVVVLASELWHPGIVGIVASRLVSRIYKPVILIALEGDKGRGSVRSIYDCNIHEGLKYCSGVLEEFGGHEQAAGLTISHDKIDEFRKKINSWAWDNLNENIFIQKVFGDVEVVLPELHKELVKELENLAPFGEGNPSPLLMCRGLKVIKSKKVGKLENHLKMLVSSEAATIDAIGFRLGTYDEIASSGNMVDLAFQLETNLWNGIESLQLKLKDIKASGYNNEIQIASQDPIAEYDPKDDIKDQYDLQAMFNHFYKDKHHKNLYVVCETVDFSNILFKYWNSYLKNLTIESYFLSGKNTYAEIDHIIQSEKQKIIFVSSAFWNYYQSLIDSSSSAVIRIDASLNNNSTNVNNIVAKINYSSISLGETIDFSSSNPCIIWVKGKSGMKTILSKLQSTKNSNSISIWDPEFNYYKQGEMLERFNKGITNALVTYHCLPRGYITRKSMDVFFEFPLDRFNWNYLMIPSDSTLLYAGQDIKDISNLIQGMFPTKDTLKLIYKLARQFKRELIDIEYGRVQEILTRQGINISEKSYKNMLNIFQELSLTGKADDPQVDLKESWRYQENIQQEQAIKEFYNAFVQ